MRVVQILQLMYHMALDAFDKAAPPTFSPPDIGMSVKDVRSLLQVSVWASCITDSHVSTYISVSHESE